MTRTGEHFLTNRDVILPEPCTRFASVQQATYSTSAVCRQSNSSLAKTLMYGRALIMLAMYWGYDAILGTLVGMINHLET